MKLLRSLYACSTSLIRDSAIHNIGPNSSTLSTNSQTVRLSRWLSLKSVCSRREAQELIQLGLVRINGKRIFQNTLVPMEALMKSFTQAGIVTEKPSTWLWMVNKPRGYICTHNDPQKRPTIYDILPPQFRKKGLPHSVGRLDYNSEGLLLITNDTTLKRLLQSPEADLVREYRVKVHGRVTQHKMKLMNSAITIKGVTYGPLRARVQRELSTNTWLRVFLKTGKNREVRKIMQKCDLEVNKLIRVSFGPYKLGNHGEGKQIILSPGLQRKLKLEKAKSLQTDLHCLIEIDTREEAIQLAKQEKNSKRNLVQSQRAKSVQQSYQQKQLLEKHLKLPKQSNLI